MFVGRRCFVLRVSDLMSGFSFGGIKKNFTLKKKGGGGFEECFYGAALGTGINN